MVRATKKSENGLPISDRVASFKTQESSTNKQIAQDSITSMAEYTKFFVSLVIRKIKVADGKTIRVGNYVGTAVYGGIHYHSA